MSFAIGISAPPQYSIFNGDWRLVTDYYLSFTAELRRVYHGITDYRQGET